MWWCKGALRYSVRKLEELDPEADQDSAAIPYIQGAISKVEPQPPFERQVCEHGLHSCFDKAQQHLTFLQQPRIDSGFVKLWELHGSQAQVLDAPYEGIGSFQNPKTVKQVCLGLGR